MKQFLSFILFFTAISAHAADLFFGDLNYFFKKGQMNISGNLGYESEKTATNSSGTKSAEKRNGYNLETQYLYGISDNFNAFVGLDYAWRMEIRPLTGSGNDYYESGLANPKLGLNFRGMNQQNGPINIDFGLVATLNLQDAEEGASNKDGNNADGRNSLEFNARFGKKWDIANEFYISAAIIRFMDGEYDQLNSNGSKNNIDVDASMDYRLGLFYQYRPVNEFMMTFGLEALQVGEVDTKSNTNVKTNSETHLDNLLSFNAKYLVTEKLIAKFFMVKGFYPNYDVDDTEVNRRRLFHYGMGVDYLF